MKGKIKVVKTLNKLLAGELTAIDQYFVHSRMYEDWGLHKLYERLDHEREEETEHADQMIKRILFLEGRPDLAQREPLNVGEDVESMLRNDLALEYKVIKNLRAAIAVCEQEQDYETRAMLVKQLEDSEEDHAYWLEKQLGLIEKIGLPNYLQSQMKSAS
ncbi:MAG: bacterioferritin [Oleiphilaceae bacterium]|nr:bacterioferritin [Oleiphilaceae bacterium]